jgi:hypothetical protein
MNISYRNKCNYFGFLSLCLELHVPKTTRNGDICPWSDSLKHSIFNIKTIILQHLLLFITCGSFSIHWNTVKIKRQNMPFSWRFLPCLMIYRTNFSKYGSSGYPDFIQIYTYRITVLKWLEVYINCNLFTVEWINAWMGIFRPSTPPSKNTHTGWNE